MDRPNDCSSAVKKSAYASCSPDSGWSPRTSMGRSNMDTVFRGRISPAAHQAHRFEPEQRVGPALGMLVEHLRCDPEDGDIETILEERVELGHAVHGVFDDRHVGSGFRIRVGDVATGGEFEDVGDPYPVGVRTLLQFLGEV